MAWIVGLAVLVALAALAGWIIRTFWIRTSAGGPVDYGNYFQSAIHLSASVRRGRERFPLGEEQRMGFLRVWRGVYEGFDRDPAVAVLYADVLVSALMRVHEQCAGGPGVDSVTRERHRIAHDRATHHVEGPLTRAELRETLEVYAALFDRLLGSSGGHAHENTLHSLGSHSH